MDTDYTISDFNNFGQLFEIPLQLLKQPQYIAKVLHLDFNNNQKLCERLSEMSLVLSGQQKFVPSHFDEDKVVRKRAEFSTQQLVILYKEFLKDSMLNKQRIRIISQDVGLYERDVLNWWYNRRSDVKDNSFQIPRHLACFLEQNDTYTNGTSFTK